LANLINYPIVSPNSIVMVTLEAAIQKNTDFSVYYWMAGSSPAMTKGAQIHHTF
jgi:hypothetical protein